MGVVNGRLNDRRMHALRPVDDDNEPGVMENERERERDGCRLRRLDASGPAAWTPRGGEIKYWRRAFR